MGMHSSNDKGGKTRRIAVASALVLGVATAIALGPIGRAPVNTTVISALAVGGGNTGNSFGGGNERG